MSCPICKRWISVSANQACRRWSSSSIEPLVSQTKPSTTNRMALGQNRHNRRLGKTIGNDNKRMKEGCVSTRAAEEWMKLTRILKSWAMNGTGQYMEPVRQHDISCTRPTERLNAWTFSARERLTGASSRGAGGSLCRLCSVLCVHMYIHMLYVVASCSSRLL